MCDEKSLFRMTKIPKIISIDAFNTLFVAKKPILKIYTELGQKYGINKSEEQLSQVFPKAFKDMKSQYPNYGKAQGLQYQDWWSKLIIKLYEPLINVQENNNNNHNKFINELLEIFESDKGYSRYDDVAGFLTNYSNIDSDGVIFVASSNGDPRVIKVLESLNLLQFFHKVYLSYDIEVSKPNEEFFNYIIDDLLQNCNLLKGIKKEELLAESKKLWHIGDELTNDLNGAAKAGWNGILIDRKNEFEKLANQQDEEDLAKIKINTDFTNTSGNDGGSSGCEDNNILKLDDKRFVTKSFGQVDQIIGLK